jgi:uncharacterized membrane protein YwzB
MTLFKLPSSLLHIIAIHLEVIMNRAGLMMSGNVTLAVDGVIFFLVFFVGLIISWWALGALKWDKIVHLPVSPQANMLRFILALLGGSIWGFVAIMYLIAVNVIRTL